MFFFYHYLVITNDWKNQGHLKSVGTLVLGAMIISELNNNNKKKKPLLFLSVFCLSVSDGPGDAQSPSTEEPPTPTESPEVKEGS